MEGSPAQLVPTLIGRGGAFVTPCTPLDNNRSGYGRMKTLSIIKYSFALIGASLLATAVYMHLNVQDFLQQSIKIQAEVIGHATHKSEGTTMYTPVIRYVARDGQSYEYTSSVSSSSPSYNVGEKVDIFYRESDPQNPKIDSFLQLYFAELIIAIFGAIFFLIGSVIIFAGISSKKKREYLLMHGQLIHAKLQEVGLNTSLSVNGRNPYLILGQWLDPATNQMHIFESDNIWFDPQEFIKTDTIPVYIAPGNPKKYWMDISFLPKVA